MRRALTLIRHGITDWNALGRFQGHSDVPLSEEGERQVRRLARRAARMPDVDLVVSSPLRRAWQTAEIAFPTREVVAEPRLMELNFGTFEGRTLAENVASPEWAAWAADPYEQVAPGGESYRDLRERVVAWYQELPNDDAHIVAIAHSGTIQMLLAHVLGIERPRWRKRIYLRHSSVTRILTSDGETVVERVNDTRHLDEDGDDPFFE